jgi:hypothetical protein
MISTGTIHKQGRTRRITWACTFLAAPLLPGLSMRAPGFDHLIRLHSWFLYRMILAFHWMSIYKFVSSVLNSIYIENELKFSLAKDQDKFILRSPWYVLTGFVRAVGQYELSKFESTIRFDSFNKEGGRGKWGIFLAPKNVAESCRVSDNSRGKIVAGVTVGGQQTGFGVLFYVG